MGNMDLIHLSFHEENIGHEQTSVFISLREFCKVLCSPFSLWAPEGASWGCVVDLCPPHHRSSMCPESHSPGHHHCGLLTVAMALALALTMEFDREPD